MVLNSMGYQHRSEQQQLETEACSLVLLPYGDKWRAHRRAFQQGFNAKTSLTYRPVQDEKLNTFLYNLLKEPDDFMTHTHFLIASVITKIVYDYNLSPNILSRLMAATQKALDNLAIGTLPGIWSVNTLPFLRFLPRWFPGCRGFNNLIDETRAAVEIMMHEGYEFALKNTTDHSSLVTLLQKSKAFSSTSAHLSDSVVREVCATAYAAGAETTKSVFSTFFLAMRQNPEVQHRAYNEIKRVVGTQRLPELTDRASLPYVEAVYREVMRWMPVTPLGVPRTTTRDDVYGGYFVPKGCMIFANVWAMNNNEEKYMDPRRFWPGRFLNTEGQFINGSEPMLAFGFGRRICVGRHFVDALVWRTVACVLAGFEISKPKDDDLRDVVDLQEVYTDGLALQAKPFRCSITPRESEIVDVIRGLQVPDGLERDLQG